MKMKCNHENLMFPVSDNNGWVVGMLCDCGYFCIREKMPKYNERALINIENKNRGW